MPALWVLAGERDAGFADFLPHDRVALGAGTLGRSLEHGEFAATRRIIGAAKKTAALFALLFDNIATAERTLAEWNALRVAASPLEVAATDEVAVLAQFLH